MAEYDLADVRRLIAGNLFEVADLKCLDTYVSLYDCTNTEGIRAILEVICGLDGDDWHDSAKNFKPFADEYGIENHRGRSWYIKFAIRFQGTSNEYLDIISFHPPERDMRTGRARIRR